MSKRATHAQGFPCYYAPPLAAQRYPRLEYIHKCHVLVVVVFSTKTQLFRNKHTQIVAYVVLATMM